MSGLDIIISSIIDNTAIRFGKSAYKAGKFFMNVITGFPIKTLGNGVLEIIYNIKYIPSWFITKEGLTISEKLSLSLASLCAELDESLYYFQALCSRLKSKCDLPDDENADATAQDENDATTLDEKDATPRTYHYTLSLMSDNYIFNLLIRKINSINTHLTMLIECMNKLIELSEGVGEEKNGSVAMIKLFNGINGTTNTMEDLFKKLNTTMKYIKLINEKKNKKKLGFGSSLTVNLPDIGIIMPKLTKNTVSTREKLGWGLKWVHNWTQRSKDSNTNPTQTVTKFKTKTLEDLNSNFLEIEKKNPEGENPRNLDPNIVTTQNPILNKDKADSKPPSRGGSKSKKTRKNRKMIKFRRGPSN
jgi:hypothetical protein